MSDNAISMPVGSYLNATGTIEYGMTNDYMFHAVLQKNDKVLKGLICSLLHLAEDEVKSVQIMNPIELGNAIGDKTFILDINVMLNNDTLINLEMQMANEKNWEERSLSYLCRSFDHLYEGQDYVDAKPVIHIGFLNFSPYDGDAEFYATYKMLNVKNHRVYSDKFVLRVVDLTQIESATEEDRESQVDYWARLFVATSWAELKLIAERSPSMSEATQTLYELNADIRTQEICRARREFQRRENTLKRDMERVQSEIDRVDAMLAEKTEELAEKTEELAEKTEALMQKDEELAALRARIAELEELHKKG